MKLFIWPAQLPASLDGFKSHLIKEIDSIEVVTINSVTQLEAPGAFDAAADVLVAFIGSNVDSPIMDSVGAVETIATSIDIDVAAVVGAGYLGTDASNLTGALAGAAAVAAVRAIAVRRDGTRRANIICIPDSMFGVETSQSGPLAQPVEASDVAHAVGFMIGGTSRYLNGQILFIDSGRHLFSSHSA